jgi:hypothetical protein
LGFTLTKIRTDILTRKDFFILPHSGATWPLMLTKQSLMRYEQRVDRAPPLVVVPEHYETRSIAEQPRIQ